jgi:hypothetical protein
VRYSRDAKKKPKSPVSNRKTNQEFFAKVWQSADLPAVDVALLLVGGNDQRSLALRRAQSALRFDRRPSLWSHAAVVFDLNAKDPARSRGVEVSLDPVDPMLQVPERNGVTEFALGRYFDTDRYPNVAFVTAAFVADGQAVAGSRKKIIQKLREPSSDPLRYPLWNALGEWARYSYVHELLRNPLLEGVIMPSAALCEFAFEAMSVDLTPGASANNTCPELIWSTVTHWQSSLEDVVKFDAYTVARNEECTAPPALSLQLDLASKA